jgi:hypothetical protein
MLDKVKVYIGRLNDSKFFAGIIMLMLNLGSRYITLNLSQTQEEFLKLSLARELLIFSIAWMGTHDIILSVLMTAAFVVLADYLFNEKSKLCILPEKFKKIEQSIDTNNDGIISEEELANAEKVLAKAKKNKERLVQMDMVNYMDVHK